MPDIKKMEGPVKFKKGVELYFDPKKDMFYDPKKKKYMSEKDILALEEVELGQELNEELQSDFEKSSFLKAYKGVLKMNGKEVWTSLPAQYKSSADAMKAAKHFKGLLDKHGYKMVSGSLEASDKAKKSMEDYDEKNAKYGKPSTTMGEEVDLFEKSEEYQKFFQSALKKFGIDSPAELDDKKKKEFFDYVDKNWEGENEEDEEETIEEKDFKPHMMYDPKTGKGYKAEKPEDHERMKKLGYTHEKPEKVEEGSELSDKMKNYVDACGKDFTNWK